MHVIVLLNAKAGSVRSSASEDHPTMGADLTAQARRAANERPDAVVAAGGDGTVSGVAGGLAGGDIPLGILPLGTLNHFARDLGLPLDSEKAIEVIRSGHVRRVDVGQVNDHVFINNSSIGIYPYMVTDRERRRAQHKLAKWMAAVPAFFRMMRHFPRRRLRILGEGFARPYRTPCLFVGNNEYGMELFTFGRRPRLDGGKLWFYVVKPREPLQFFWMVCRMCFGRLDQARDLDTFQLAEAEVGAKTSRLPVALDGDVQIMHTPLRYRARPRALSVIVPLAGPD
jgi:diacylglycerol kinase family enzyme